MSIFGSLFTAVSGMSAQSQSLSMISDNIANVNTVGYKETNAAFSSLVTSSSRSVVYSPGSVEATQQATVDQQGTLQQTSSSTDIALSGNGFFVVKAQTNSLSEPLYTRAGSFSENSDGVLQNTGGFFLYGWPLDQNGNIPAGAADVNSLQPVNVAFLGGLTQPTTTANLSLNLDAAEKQAPYPVASGTAADFSRDLTVYDSLGSAESLTVNFIKEAAPTATAVGTSTVPTTGPLAGQPGFTAGANFTIQVGTNPPVTISLNGDAGKMTSDINAITDASGNPEAFASIDAQGHLQIQTTTPGTPLVLTDGTGTPLASGFGITAGTFAAPAAPAMLTATNSTPNTQGWWDVQFLSSTGALVSEGSINFTSDGKLNAATDPQTGQTNIALNNIDWGNGSSPQDITFDISKFTQYDGEYNVVSSNQNGAALGLRTGISIDADGFVTAQFSNGKSAKIYKLPVATFANVNGLDSLTGNVYRESDSSGNFNLREAGQGSAGTISSGALEGSNVDLADEFSKMIITQRAYSANTKVVSTADQMTQDLLNLR